MGLYKCLRDKRVEIGQVIQFGPFFIKLRRHTTSYHLSSFIRLRSPKFEDRKIQGSMTSEAPNWADQWGAGGFGAMVDDDDTADKKDSARNKKDKEKGWLSRATEAALKEATKLMIKLGISKMKQAFSKKSKKKKGPSE